MTQIIASEAAAGANGAPAVEIGHDLVREFCQDALLLDRLQVTPKELEALSQSSLLGSISSKQDVLFMLRTIRRCLSPAPDEDDTAAIYFEMAQEIRRSALSQLEDRETRRRAIRGRRWQRFGLRNGFLRAVWPLMEACFVGQPSRLLRQCRESSAGVIVSGGDALRSSIAFLYHRLLAKVRTLRDRRAVGGSVWHANGEDCDVGAVCLQDVGIVGRMTPAPVGGEYARARIRRRRLSRSRISWS